MPSKHSCQSAARRGSFKGSLSKVHTKEVGYLTAKDKMPLNVVHGVGFHKMVEKLNPQYKLPSCKVMTQKVLPKMLKTYTVFAWTCLPCFAHTPNLLVKAALCTERINQVVSRCSRLVAFFSKKEQRRL